MSFAASSSRRTAPHHPLVLEGVAAIAFLDIDDQQDAGVALRDAGMGSSARSPATARGLSGR